MNRPTSFIIAAIMSFACADFSLAQTTYPDGRPSATLRMEAKDQGVVLKHGDGPGQCDYLGAREALIFVEKGVYHLFYDGAGPKGWLACLATSRDLKTWEKKGPMLDFGKPGESDSAAACSPWVYFDGKDWHMFYLGTPNASGAPDLVPSFPYLTLKARSKSLAGPWIKQPDVIPFRTKPKTYYADTASPGHIVKQGDEYLMFFSASMKRTISIARTKDLNSPWAIDPQPIVPPEEQIENSSLYFEPSNKTWFLFTNHIGLGDGEYTDAVWVYWSKDLNAWNTKNKAVVLDGKNCTWSKKCLGMPSVVKVGKRLAIFYDAPGGDSDSHMKRDIGLAWLELPLVPPVPSVEKIEANCVAEVAVVSAKNYSNPFMEVELDAVVTRPDGNQLRVPGFWAGGKDWRIRYASDQLGTHTWRTECSDAANSGLHGVAGKIEVVPSRGENPLFKHGPICVAKDQRHFAHADGTPFLWLGDTWWKCLCKRMTWEGFQELTADRKAKGFSVVQIVCGPYPDEDFFQPSLENEGGQPYLAKDMSVVNPTYFEYADRRFKHLVDAGIVPAIVGAWGRGDCNSMQAFGAVHIKRHWRYLIARYGAYPVVWILAGEIADETKWGQGPWAEVAKYVREIDPYKHPLTCHTGQGRRGAEGDVCLIDYDMVGGNHDEREAVANGTLTLLTAACAKKPAVPVLCGETCYEGHMQQGFGDVQRHIFWRNMLSGAAGHTYGAAGIWHAGVEGDHGNWGAWDRQPYDWTTWKEGMNYPGSTQLGIGKKLLEQYPWSRFEPHSEWVDNNCFAAGIPGEVRFVYLPRRNIYNWDGPEVKNPCQAI